MKIYEVKTEKERTYFLRTWSTGGYAYGYKLVCKDGTWATRKARYDASDLRNFPDKFPLICTLDLDDLKKLVLRTIVDSKYLNLGEAK